MPISKRADGHFKHQHQGVADVVEPEPYRPDAARHPLQGTHMKLVVTTITGSASI